MTGTPQNLWAESLDSKPARQLTRFPDHRRIADAPWLRGGKRIATAGTTTTTDIALKGLKRC